MEKVLEVIGGVVGIILVLLFMINYVIRVGPAEPGRGSSGIVYHYLFE
jgi:hypothetical protein